ncbi:MAG: leucine-rich repeat domain-containing protein, partial [Stomatobaculum longum]
LRSLEPLRALTGLRSLDIGDSTELTDLNALSALTGLRELRVANADWSVKGKLPDLSGLTALEELEASEEDFAQFAACKSLKKLTLFMNRFGDSADFTALAGLDQLEELYLNFDRDDEKPVHIESLSALPALRKLTIVGEDGPLPLGAFPQVKDITVIGNNIVSNLSTDALRIDPAPDGENTALTRLSIIGFQGGIQIGGYGSETKDSAALSVLSHCTALRELRLNHCGLTDLTFVNAIPNVEVLDIVGNRIEDISPLTALSKLRALYCADNDIQNIAVLRGRGILLLE